MEQIDLSKNSRKIQEAYNDVVNGNNGKNYVVYTVEKDSSLSVGEVGQGSLEDFVENFEDGTVQFGLAKVPIPGSDVFKNLLVGWCPDSAPAKSRLSFASNFANVSKVLSGYHVQITARDQDDLDVNEFLERLGAAAGASYSGPGVTRPVTSAKPKPTAPKPFVAKAPAQSSIPKPSVPKSTGKPIVPAGKPPVSSPKPNSDDDEWGGEKQLEERDFTKKPLENVPSAYKPTKVDIGELRKQKSDTVSSAPRIPSLSQSGSADKPAEERSISISEKVKEFSNNDVSDGRLTSLPKPKVNNAVASRFKPVEEKTNKPTFGAKPSWNKSSSDKNDKVLGGFSRNFATENGKTPAQIWAEKRGKYKSVSPEPDNADSKVNQISDDLANSQISNVEESHVVKPSSSSFGSFNPQNNEPEEEPQDEPEKEEVPQEKEKEEDEEEEEEEETKPTPPQAARNLPPPPPARETPASAPQPPSFPSRNSEVGNTTSTPKEEAPEPLPARNLPPPPASWSQNNTPATQAEAPSESPVKKDADESTSGVSAIAEYDYEKDEDNELGFEEGDLIVDIDFVDEEWWSGKHSKTGEVGLFPAAYVNVQSSERKASEPTTDSKETGTSEAGKAPSAVAEYDYEKDEDNEIGFSEGDLIMDIEFVDEDWWSGKHSKTGEAGLFPANYVNLVEN
ncbi:Piso0_002536 [Millerozyma farinosa CBS 7064]|uniref:Piso0_002536 protein n=1 Tax=Pichia sorbitophila (strain ATCC MYA-4447 / BCRC 22081 / CBS 7064 / NBRC 10061 / NRRL Y-12695) TaxID=559304 RepID=G8YCV9_PICSO|nr:Piso0_002536 [Millerozyma farinosa CBS 7064]